MDSDNKDKRESQESLQSFNHSPQLKFDQENDINETEERDQIEPPLESQESFIEKNQLQGLDSRRTELMSIFESLNTNKRIFQDDVNKDENGGELEQCQQQKEGLFQSKRYERIVERLKCASNLNDLANKFRHLKAPSQLHSQVSSSKKSLSSSIKQLTQSQEHSQQKNSGVPKFMRQSGAEDLQSSLQKLSQQKSRFQDNFRSKEDPKFQSEMFQFRGTPVDYKTPQKEIESGSQPSYFAAQQDLFQISQKNPTEKKVQTNSEIQLPIQSSLIQNDLFVYSNKRTEEGVPEKSNLFSNYRYNSEQESLKGVVVADSSIKKLQGECYEEDEEKQIEEIRQQMEREEDVVEQEYYQQEQEEYGSQEVYEEDVFSRAGRRKNLESLSYIKKNSLENQSYFLSRKGSETQNNNLLNWRQISRGISPQNKRNQETSLLQDSLQQVQTFEEFQKNYQKSYLEKNSTKGNQRNLFNKALNPLNENKIIQTTTPASVQERENHCKFRNFKQDFKDYMKNMGLGQKKTQNVQQYNNTLSRNFSLGQDETKIFQQKSLSPKTKIFDRINNQPEKNKFNNLQLHSKNSATTIFENIQNTLRNTLPFKNNTALNTFRNENQNNLNNNLNNNSSKNYSNTNNNNQLNELIQKIEKKIPGNQKQNNEEKKNKIQQSRTFINNFEENMSQMRIQNLSKMYQLQSKRSIA